MLAPKLLISSQALSTNPDKYHALVICPRVLDVTIVVPSTIAYPMLTCRIKASQRYQHHLRIDARQLFRWYPYPINDFIYLPKTANLLELHQRSHLSFTSFLKSRKSMLVVGQVRRAYLPGFIAQVRANQFDRHPSL